jgi:hypothetical protein
VDQDAPDRLLGEPLILGGERVDRGWDRLDPGRIADGGCVLPSGEDERVGSLEVGLEEPPSLLGVLVRLVGSDVTAPDDPGSPPRKVRDQPRRLGIVEQDDVVGPDERTELERVLVEHALVEGPDARVQRHRTIG